MAYAHERNAAVEAVKEAAALCAAVREEMVFGSALAKADRSPVTVADFGSQALICRRLRQAFPTDPIVAEEDASDLRKPQNEAILNGVKAYANRYLPEVSSRDLCEWIDLGNGKVADRYWTLDPVDGTKGFLRNDQYAVALALVEHGEVKMGVMVCPALRCSLTNREGGCLFVAIRGEGATAMALSGGEAGAIRVAQETRRESWRFAESVESAHGNPDLQRRIADAAGIRLDSLRMDSQAKYGVVARGEAVLYLRLPSVDRPDYREKIWDHAAGSIVVEEAGGRTSDMRGRPLDFASGITMDTRRGVVVSNGEIHDAVIDALAETEVA